MRLALNPHARAPAVRARCGKFAPAAHDNFRHKTVNLSAGTYDLVVYALSTVSGTFNQSKERPSAEPAA